IVIGKYNDQTKTYSDFRHLIHDPERPGSLSDNWIYTAFPDRYQQNSWWIGTALGGITYIQQKAKPFNAHFLKTEELPVESGTYIRSTLIDKNENVWFSLERGLVKHNVESGKYEYFSAIPDQPGALQNYIAYTIIEDKKGRKWAGTYEGIHQIIDLPNGKTFFKHFPYPETCNSVLTFSMSEDKNGQLLLGTATGLNVFDPETQTYQGCSRVLDTLLGYQNGYFITDIHRDKKNNVWISTTKGLVLIKGISNFYQQLNEAQPLIFRHNPDDIYSLRNDAINNLAEDNEGNIWLGTMNGVIRVSPDGEGWKFDSFTEKDGLANNVVYAVMADSITRTLWLSTNNGISRFDLGSEEFDNYDLRDGLQGNEFNQGAFSKTRNGQFIFGGIGGYTRFFPSKIQQDPYPPRVFLTRFSGGDGTPRDFMQTDLPAISLDYTENTFALEFTGINYTDPKRNTYEYRLSSPDQTESGKWIKVGTSRQVNMTNLPPGEYLFEVRAFNGDGITSGETAKLEIIIRPPFWRTYWFILLVISGILGLLWLFHWSRVQVKVRRVIELERVRKNTAADFHDELGHKLTIISLFGEIVKKQLSKSGEGYVPHLDKIISTSNSLYYSMKDLLWVLDPEKDSVLDLAILLKDFGDELFDKTGIAFRTEGIKEEMSHYLLPMDQKRHIVLIFKEAMNNALKHSQGKNAVLRIQMKQELILTFADDGVGFDISEAGNGHGLANLRERARNL
ncbi:MAG: hypothetical protein KDD63_23490, partial [Bacteroidetes bacterium]|nr:hypothetical protein [Bacteroidota bacterium]